MLHLQLQREWRGDDAYSPQGRPGGRGEPNGVQVKVLNFPAKSCKFLRNTHPFVFLKSTSSQPAVQEAGVEMQPAEASNPDSNLQQTESLVHMINIYNEDSKQGMFHFFAC